MRQRTGISRRDVIALAAWGAAAAAGCRKQKERAAPTDRPPSPSPPPAAGSLTAPELRALDALTARILPALPDSGTPGAREAGVAHFIDLQLATPQMAPLLPAVQAGLAVLDDLARSRHGHELAALAPAEIDALVDGLARGTLPAARLPQAALFRALHTLTLEGYLCDPLHGGNADMVGWKAIGFPVPPRRAAGAPEPGGSSGGGHDHH